jgi:hypothetical protein
MRSSEQRLAVAVSMDGALVAAIAELGSLDERPVFVARRL